MQNYRCYNQSNGDGLQIGVLMGWLWSDFIIKRMSSVFREECEQENGNFYSLYKEDDTLKKEVQPCKLSELLRFSNPLDKLLMALGCFFALGNGVSLIFYSQPLKDLVMAFDPHSDPQQILGNLTFAIKAFLVNSIFVFLNASLMTITWTLTSQRQLIRVRNLYFESLMKQEFAWYDRNKPEEVCSNMYMQTERAQSSLVESINSILTTISMGLGGIIFALAHGWKMAVVMAGFIPVMMVTNYVTTRLAKRWETKFVDRATSINANVIETFQNIKTVKYLGGEDYEISKFTQQAQTNSKYVTDYGRRTVFTSAITFFCIIFNYALGFWYGTKLVADRVYNSSTGKIYDVGDVVSIFFCVYIANLNISGVAGHITNFYNSRVALSRIMAVIDRQPRQTEGTESCLAGIRKIEFRDIAFHYSQPLFQRLSLTIEKGVVAIVGSSGNGKSTLLYLLMKFYDPFKGEILLHGENETQNLRDVQRKSLRNRIGYVGQEPVLLGNTIREVLGSTKQDAIWKALSICCAEEFVRNIGLDADFKALSGGQKQRIAIARAVLRDPQILVLDEGTSALDGINERRLLRNLKEKSKIEFIFMIAHRTETLSQAQTIIKVDRGNAEIIHSEIAVRIADKSNEEQNAVEQMKQGEQRQQRQQEQEKSVFKFSYLKALLRLNGSMKQFYVTGILSSMFLGVIFPSFSYIITRLCSIVTDIQYATTTEEVQTLQQQASFISLFLLGISIASIGLTIVKGKSFLALGENIGLKTKIYSYSHLIKLQMAEIQRIGRTNITHLINSNANSAKEMASGLIANMSEHFFTLIVGLSIAFIYCWQITLVSLFLIPLSLIGGKLQQKFLSGLAQNADKVYRKTHQIVKEAVIHNRTVKSLNLQENYCIKYRKEQSKGFRRSIKGSVLSGITLGVSQCLISLMLSLIYYIGALFVKHYGVSIVDLFTAIYAIMFSGVQAGCNIGFVGQIAENGVGTARYFKLLALGQQDPFGEEKLGKNELVEELQDESVLAINNDQIRGSVEFKGVSFRYPHRDDYVFRNLCFHVDEGKRVAIVGQSGSGKTTIADLLFKIYRPEQGEVLLDGVSTAIYSRVSLSQNLAIVSQEPALFNRSVIENIKYNAEVTEKEAKEAAKVANAFDFIEAGGFGVEGTETQKKGNNWERVVGSRGSLLSGGQKQRVAIARAIVRKPRVMVFDEATSALDKETEQSLLLNVSKNLKMTQIIIAHRLSTIRACDAIIVLKGGQVVECGEYEELVRKKGEFSRLVNALSEQP